MPLHWKFSRTRHARPLKIARRGGFMGRLCVSMLGGVSVLTLIFALGGCGTKTTRTVNFPAPASISLSPASSASMDVGAILGFTATPRNSINATISTPVSFERSEEHTSELQSHHDLV